MKPHCYAPWNHLFYLGQGGVAKPCCNWTGDVYTGDVSEYYESDYLTQIKQDMFEKKNINTTCHECAFKEKIHGSSSRTAINDSTERGNYSETKLSKLDIRPSNKCNLKCVMCTAEFSSLIEEEQIKQNIIEPLNIQTFDFETLDTSELCVLKLLGGEPTITNDVDDIIDFIESKGIIHNVALEYTTNGTSINNRWLNKIKNFRKVDVVISLDGTGPCFEYIRHGANWNHVSKNVERMQATMPVDAISVNVVVQFVNVAVIEKWIEYFLQFQVDNIDISPVLGSYAGSLSVLPDSLRLEKIELLTQYNHPVANKFLAVLEDAKFDQEDYDRFWIETRDRDLLRQTDIFSVDPVFREIYEMYNE